jgi:lysophospholipase L1-like esterase
MVKISAAVILAIALLVVPGCAPARTAIAAPPPLTTQPVAVPRHAPITVAAVGDSITAWNGSSPIAHTWTLDLQGGPVIVDQSQGWAFGGKHLADMLAGLAPVTDNYLVVMGGTNDVGPRTLGLNSPWGTPLATMEAQLSAIVAKSSLPANRIVICAIAPMNSEPAAPLAWNAAEQALAAANGWTFFDPWVGIRNADDTYPAALTLDGIHPNDLGSQMVATAISAEISTLKAQEGTK